MAAFGSARKTIEIARPAQRPWGTLVTSVQRGIISAAVNPANEPDNYIWGAGAVLTGEACGLFEVSPIECDMPLFTGDSEWGDNFVFDPLLVWSSRICGVLSGRTGEVLPAARRQVEEQIGFALAQELYLGATTGNAAITVDPVVLTVASALNCWQAVEALEEAVAQRVGNLQAIFHVSPAMLVCLRSSDAVEREPDGLLYTPTGHLVIADGGYTGAAPSGADVVDENGDPVSPAALGDGEEYIYVTGPIAWDYGPEQTFGPGDAGTANARQNRMRGFAQRPALAVFDPSCLHLAVLASSSGCCPQAS